MTNKKFSIIVTAYNIDNYIENCINSVKKQTYNNYELIIVDDCSTDDGKTVNKIKEFDNIIFLQTEKNSGAGGARNLGIKNATGDYIIFLDSDDALSSESILENLNNLIGNDNPDIIYTGFKFIGGEEFSFIPNEENSSKEFRLAKNKFINVWSICWNRTFLLSNNIKFSENVIYEDVYFSFAGIALSKSYKYAPFITHDYTRERPGSTSNKTSNPEKHFKQANDTIKCIKDLCSLKTIIDKEYIPYLLQRIHEQQSRLSIRLERGINCIFDNN